MRACWNRQTGTFEGRVSTDVWVQVPLLAPFILPDCVKVARQTLTLFVWVRILVRQPNKNLKVDRNLEVFALYFGFKETLCLRGFRNTSCKSAAKQ